MTNKTKQEELQVETNVDGYRIRYNMHLSKNESDAINLLINQEVSSVLEKIKSKARMRQVIDSVATYQSMVVHMFEIEEIERKYRNE